VQVGACVAPLAPAMSRLRVLLLVGGFPTHEAPNRCVFNRNAAEDLSEFVDLKVVFLRMWRPGRRMVTVEGRNHGPLVTVAVPALPWAALRAARRIVTTINVRLFRAIGMRLLKPEVGGVDLVHSAGINLAGVVASDWSDRLGCAHVAQCMGSDVNSVMPKIRAVPGILGWEGRVDGFACNSRALSRAILKLYPESPNVRVVYRGVDLSVFSPDGPSKGPPAKMGTSGVRFLYLGGLPDYPGLPWGRDTKGGLTLMSAWAQSEEVLAGLGARLFLSGPEADLEMTRKWRGGLRRPDLVEVKGAIPPADVPGCIRAADAVLLPSREEGLPNVAMEAAACSRTVIGSGVGGTAEVVEDGVTGWIMEPGSPEALASAMVEAAEDHGRLRRFGDLARARMEQMFDRRSYAPAMMDLYQAAMAYREGRLD